MESINIIKGYSKVDTLGDQTSPHHNRTTQNHRTTIAISLIIILTVVIGAVIGALIYESITEPPDDDDLSSKAAESLKTICSVTQYTNSCFTSLSSFNANFGSKIDPECVFKLSIQVAVTEFTKLESVPITLISKLNDPSTESALKDCTSLFDDGLSQLNRSLELMEVDPGEKVLTEAKIGDLNSWISGAMTDQQTCLDGLEEMGSTVVDEVRMKVQKSKEYMSNSLAILANIQSLLDKFDLKMH
ncbi:unnamed protein product [Ilex paraguariensis]|uniref:pectinesterase n=1 Tax=Ilex paraguariensis TaxID=185542 RepID=A0ABC8SVD6_9AQUA